MTVADTVLINGKVATVDRHFRFTRAIAVKTAGSSTSAKMKR